MPLQDVASKYAALRQELPRESAQVARECQAFQRGRVLESPDELLYLVFLYSIVDELVAQDVIIQMDGTWMLQDEDEHLTTAVPESIRHLVARQRERLARHDQQVLEAASIAGMEFSVAAVAAALDTEVIAVGARCAQLAERQQFLRPAGIAEWPDGTVTARYGFLHALYQQLWHERVNIEQQQQWHLRIGERKEVAYGNRTSEIATELAVHFEQGRAYPRAVHYLRQAGENAVRRSASAEAISYFTRGLELLKTLPETPEHAYQELMAHVSLGPILMMTNGRSAPVVENAYTRALQLCHQTGEQAQLFSALRGLWECYETRGEFQRAHQLAEQFFAVAKLSQDPAHLLIAHDALGDTLFWRGEFVSAREHLEQGVALYNPRHHAALAFFHGGYDPGVACTCLGACVMWILGYADQALARMDAALTLARQLGHLHSQASALIWAAVLHHLRREAPLTQERAAATIPLSREQGFPYYLAAGTAMRGWALAEQGQGSEGITQIRQGVEVCKALGVEMARTYFLALLAEAYGTAGQPVEGFGVLDEALQLVNTNGERLCEAELYRLCGELTLQQFTVADPQPLTPDPQGEAEACFLKAIAVAQKQQAKSLELRAVISLVRLRQQTFASGLCITDHASRSKLDKAHGMLSSVYRWFTEGFDTEDLREAKALLEALP